MSGRSRTAGERTWVVAALCIGLLAHLFGCHHRSGATPPASEPAAPLQLVSGAVALTATDGGFPLVLSSDAGPLVQLDLDSFQVGTVHQLDSTLSYDPYWMLHSDSTLPAVIPPGFYWDAPDGVTLQDAGANAWTLLLSLTDGAQASVQITASGDDQFDALFTPDPTAAAAILRIRLHVTPQERFYGLGEWLDSPEHRGALRPMQLEPNFSVESSDTENHVTVPLLLSSSAWGLFVKSRRPAVFDVGFSDPALVDALFATTTASAQGLEFHLFAEASPLDLMRHYYAITGPPALPAPWALGPLIWRDQDANQAQVDSDVDTLRSLNLATSAIWLDRPYASAVESFDFDPSEYIDAGAMIAHAQAEGLRVAVWHAPYLEAATGVLRATATDAGFFPPQSGVLFNSWSPPIDFTNADAGQWWDALLRRYTDVGVEGFKLDYGEDVTVGVAGGRTEWRFADGEDEGTMASGYSVVYHQAYARMLPPDGGFLLCRAGHWGDQAYAPIIWPGDIDATLTTFGQALPLPDGGSLIGVGGLPSALSGALSLSASGFPFYAADTGGYRHAPADKETWIRWVEQSSLGVAMETGDSSSQVPWDRDSESLADYQTYALLHMRLFPYVWSYVQSLPTTGRPVIRALGFAHPELVSPPNDEYLLGDALLVAPITQTGATTRTVVFPSGVWISWWDGSSHMGMETATANLDSIPLYVASGSIVPLLRPTIATLAPATDPAVDDFGRDAGVLSLRVFSGTGSFQVYDGTSLTQSSGALSITPGTVFVAGYAIEWIGVSQPSAVSDQGAPVSGWSWSANQGGTLTLNVGAGAHQLTLTP